MTAFLEDTSLAGLHTRLSNRSLTPPSITRYFLSRIAALNPIVRALVHVDGAGACAAAEASSGRWKNGLPLSVLDGIPIVVKANIAVRGMPWHAGIAAYRDRIATEDADCVARLRAAGAIILGLSNMDEAALGGCTDNSFFGHTRNPWFPTVSAGGSSGGSAAAVAAGLCAFALGTDTLGSVRLPAAYCGIVGHKMAHDAISARGIVPLAAALDGVGILAAHAADAVAVRNILTRAIPQSDQPTDIAVLRFDGQVEIDPVISQALEEAVCRARNQGKMIQEVRLPDAHYARLRKHAWVVLQRDAATYYAEMIGLDPEGFSAALRRNLGWAAAQPTARIAEARETIRTCGTEIRSAIAAFSAVLAPTMPAAAHAWDRPAPPEQATFTAIANVAGASATAFPVGIDADGLPVSLQSIGRQDLAIAEILGQACIK